MKISMVAITALAVLAGCGSMANRFAVDKLGSESISANRGIVLISTGATSGCVSNGTFLRVLQSNQPPASTEILNIPVDEAVLKSDFDDHQGFVSAVSLPTGDYYFAPFTLRGLGSQRFPSFKFSIGSDEIVYLGEVFALASCSVLNATRLEVRDRSERDIEFFRSKNSGLALHPIIKRIISESGEVRG